ncbi:type III secretion system translocator chaperone SicA [Burkholderia sp. BE17]|uniref:type III secretion system translocator chaperone SicA n=1 Tax=Burkholderia sp. BE17 TaxID=2656644 RepID=UPI0039F10345
MVTMEHRDTNRDEATPAELADALLKAVESGAALKDLQGVSDELMDGIYAFAYHFYRQDRLDDAEVFFRFLCVYDFHNPEYTMGLAAVHQLKKDYAKAIDLYALAYSQSNDDCRPMFHAGQCHLQMGKAVLARRCFQVAEARSEDAALKQMAASYLSGLDEIAATMSDASTPVNS